MRANAGLAVGRARGRKGGRPKALSAEDAETIRIARATFYKHVGSVIPDRTPAK